MGNVLYKYSLHCLNNSKKPSASFWGRHNKLCSKCLHHWSGGVSISITQCSPHHQIWSFDLFGASPVNIKLSLLSCGSVSASSIWRNPQWSSALPRWLITASLWKKEHGTWLHLTVIHLRRKWMFDVALTWLRVVWAVREQTRFHRWAATGVQIISERKILPLFN